jgi:predicted nucleic acid-binding protein
VNGRLVLLAWLEVAPVDAIDDAALEPFGGRRTGGDHACAALRADLILIDERKGTSVALSKGFDVTGTLGVLRLAARRGLVDLASAFTRLKRTNFRYRQEILDALLNQNKSQ